MKYILTCLLFLAGCTSVSQKLDPRLFYKRDMKIEVNGFKGEGVLVVRSANNYDFAVDARGRLDLFTFTTCHREETKEKAGEGGLFGNKHKRTWNFVPVNGMEAGGISCPVQLGGYEKVKGRHSWALVDFEHPDLTLPAKIKCNGSVYNSKGVSICQSKTGLIQEISFTTDVLTTKQKHENCPPLESKDMKVFRYEIPKGQCVYRFLTKGGDAAWHRHTTIGYEKILIRSN